MIEFGEKYRDKITGFVATATARTEYEHGLVSVRLERAGSDGKPEEVWLPESRLEQVRVEAGFGIRPVADASGPGSTPPAAG